MEELTLVQRIVVWILPVIFAITVHEVAHGWVAKKFGDNTASALGRLTLNPIKHIDILGTIILPGLLLLTGTGFIFGWAKPVPVDARNFKKPLRDMAIVAVAGPLSNEVRSGPEYGSGILGVKNALAQEDFDNGEIDRGLAYRGVGSLSWLCDSARHPGASLFSPGHGRQQERVAG